ncbi:hypothetical protein C8P67_102414 [Flavobacterium aquicola]|uniref:Uncharacterized protein n=1 Tax=Flavobacterium aquicola TaxID=1682742 RepID=A0A3E0ESC5_9FLAO|nr:hypothetical protein [Flavobacterium aquicola]REH01155.1 hypothetical protein C8P67_102414 [Flavobacterium aquicola]
MKIMLPLSYSGQTDLKFLLDGIVYQDGPPFSNLNAVTAPLMLKNYSLMIIGIP